MVNINNISYSAPNLNNEDKSRLDKSIKELVNLPAQGVEESLEKAYYKIDQPFTLELIGLELFKKGASSPELNFVYYHWGVQFLEKGAAMLQLHGDYLKAMQLRLTMANKLLLTPPFNLQPGVLQYVGGKKIRNGCLHYREIRMDHYPFNEITFHLSFAAAQEVIKNLQLLDHAEVAQQVIASGLCSSISQATTPYIFYKLENNTYQSNHPQNIEVGTALSVKLEGVGVIQVGNSEVWGSMITAVRLWFDGVPSFPVLAKVLSIMGIGEILTPSSNNGITRIKVNSLIRFFAPKFAADHDFQEWYHHVSINYLLAQLPAKTAKKIEKNLKKLTVYNNCGEQRYQLKHLTDKVEALGGRGFMVQCFGPIQEAAAKLGSIFKKGLFSKQKLFENGHTHIKGSSTLSDFKKRSGDGVFCTLLTESSLQHKFSESPLIGNIQIFARLKIFNKMPYCYNQDEYGTRRRGSGSYSNRPLWKEYVITQQKNWTIENEAILKNHISATELSPLIIYQDCRRTLLKVAEAALNLSGLSEKEKLDKLSALYATDKSTLFNALKGPYFDPVTEVFTDPDEDREQTIEKKLATHWLIDVRKAIENSLIAADLNVNNFIIKEQTEITQDIFEACYTPLYKKAQKLALQPHLATSQYHPIRADAHLLIDQIRSYLAKLSLDELYKLVSKEQNANLTMAHDWCAQYLSNINYSGQDSLNRELLTHSELSFLSTSEGIIALFAIEEIEKIEISKLNTFNCLLNKNIVERTISDCLYYGLKKHHPVLLERLPNNKLEATVLTKPHKYLREYLNRASRKAKYRDIIQAVEDAYVQLLNIPPPLYHTGKCYADQPYNVQLWKGEYQDIFKKILHYVDITAEDKLLGISANQYTPDKLKDQVLTGFSFLMAHGNKQAKKMSLREIVQYITQSEALLNQEICHYFYDHIHFLAALKSKLTPCIQTLEGPVSLRKLMTAIINSFAKGVNASNSIAAEQFYLRLIQISYKV